MKIELEKGCYIAAVSGGVDSVVLLDLATKASSHLVVAHLDHGIRPQSAQTATFVANLAKDYRLKFMTRCLKLGSDVSEEKARQARYDFLKNCQNEIGADGILLAHHRDDLIETAAFNLLRGTGRRGLSSLASQPPLIRPLLGFYKSELVDYAQRHNLVWQEDETNLDLKYSRNYLRHKILPHLSPSERRLFEDLIDQVSLINQKLDRDLALYIRRHSYRSGGKVFSRRWFNSLPHPLAQEVVYCWLTAGQATNLSHSKIDYIVVKLKTLAPGKEIVVGVDQKFCLTKRSLRLFNLAPISYNEG